MRRYTWRTRVCVGACVMIVAASASAGARCSSTVNAHREDYGALSVLDVYGSYRDMGCQQVELLGPEAREMGDLYRSRLADVVRARGVSTRLMGAVLFPLWAMVGPFHDDSSFFDEAFGIAEALRISDADAVRLVYGAVFGGGSTAFAATRTATADGGAIVGRNVDWSDDGGRRRPIAIRYHPANGDLVHVIATWPLVLIPIVGINEAGLTVSINFFDADKMIAFRIPRFLYRRVLQRATTVDEALAILAEGGNRGGPGFLVLADAAGAIALAECAVDGCAVHRPADDWLAQSNHARTEAMRPHDEGRTADSFRRRAAMEAAVRGHLGEIAPQVAATILRDRSNSAFINDYTVANLRVLNSVVVQPAARVMWHSTTMQPIAAFGEMIPLCATREACEARPLAADPRLGAGGLQHEVEIVAAMREAARIFATGRPAEAGAAWDRLADAERLLEPRRLAWARARARWASGRLAEAERLLAVADVDDAPFEIRAYARVARAMLADRLGRRSDAVDGYRSAEAYLDEHSEYDAAALIAPLRAWVRTGLARGNVGAAMPEMPDLLAIPR
jgi:hypothetical protein